MNQTEAITILNWVNKNPITDISNNYNVLELHEALQLCYVGNQKKLVRDTIDKIIEIHTIDGRIIQMKALMLIDDQKYNDAINLLSLVPHDDNQFLSCVELIGMVFLNTYQFQKGIDTFSAILALSTNEINNAYLYYNRSICYQYLSKYEEALKDNIYSITNFIDDFEFYKEAIFNLHRMVIEEIAVKNKLLILEMEKICTKIIDEYFIDGAYLFLIELAFLRTDLEAINAYLKDFKNCLIVFQELTGLEDIEPRVNTLRQILPLQKLYTQASKSEKVKIEKKIEKLSPSDLLLFKHLRPDF